MARLFIREKPIECEVEVGMGLNTFYLPKYSLDGFEIYPGAPNNLGAKHIHIVHEGNCYATATVIVMGNKQIRLGCILLENDPLGDVLVLTDMILN